MGIRIQSTMTLGLCALSIGLTNCSSGNGIGGQNALGFNADTSMSGTVAGAVGGALSSTAGNGANLQALRTQVPNSMISRLQTLLDPLPSAFASAGTCPSALQSNLQCSVSGDEMWLSFSDCAFAHSPLVNFSGVEAFTVSSGMPVCGQFPNPGANGTLFRQFVQASGANSPGQFNVNINGISAVVDDESANLANFDNDTIAPNNSDGGYGVAVQFNANSIRDSLTVEHRVAVSGVFDHSVLANLAVDEGSPMAGERTVSGTATVYHNLLQIIGSSVLNGVVHSNSCCYPVSGQIQTTFSAGANVAPTAKGAELVGKSETLTFTGCGTATLLNYLGQTAQVNLSRCF